MRSLEAPARVLLRTVTIVAMCLLASCESEPTAVVDVYRTTALMGVVVRGGDGVPRPGVLVRTSTYLFACGESLRGGTGDQATDSAGQRRVLASSLYSPHLVTCIRVTVSQRESPSAILAEQDFPVELEFRVHDGTLRDSLGLVVVLP